MAETSPSTEEPDGTKRNGLFAIFLDGIEWLGNKLPHPVVLFALFAFGVVLLSGLAGALELSVEDPRPVGAKGRSEDGTIVAISLLNAAGLRRIITSLVTNFTHFKTLGTVLVALLGVGVAEASGLLSACIRAAVQGAPRHLVTLTVVFAGVLSNTASEMGYVVLIPLAAVIFHALGRHPLAGLAAALSAPADVAAPTNAPRRELERRAAARPPERGDVGGRGARERHRRRAEGGQVCAAAGVPALR